MKTEMEAHRFFENINGHEIFYVQSEPVLTKQVLKKTFLVFLHPFAFDYSIWKYQWEYFKDTYPMIAIDMPGFGKSLLDPDFNITPEYFQDVISELILRKGITSVVLIGNSLGGGVALSLYPKLNKIIKGYFLMAPMTMEGVNIGFFKQLGMLFLKIPGGITFSKFIAPMLPTRLIINMIFNVSFEKAITTLVRHGFKDYLQHLYQNPLALQNLMNVTKLIPHWVTLNENLYSIIDVPVILLWGRQDKVLPCEAGVHLDEHLPNSKLLIFTEVGHLPQLEHHEKTNLLLEDFF